MTQYSQEEFDAMYHELFPKMVNFAGRLCRNRDEAEDITQDAFVKAYKSFDTCDSNHRVDNWMMKIVYNTFLDRKRSKSRRVKEAGDTLPGGEFTIEDFADSRSNPEQALIEGTISPELLSALATLDADSRELIRKIFVERVDQLELSKEYGIRIGTLRSRVHRIIVRLRGEFATLNPSQFFSI